MVHPKSPPFHSHDPRWSVTREEDSIPSEPSTPAAHSSLEDPFSKTSSGARSRSGSAINAPRPLNIDAEDEDVKIAIMALGAMKHLDGRSRSGSEEDGSRGVSARLPSCKSQQRSPDLIDVVSASRSVSSTAISSPSSSTPALDPGLSITSSSASTTPSTSATLADLPPDFQFPAIIHDENGNELRVDAEDMKDADFLKRVSHLPIVRGTIRAYELGKQRSRVVKYGGHFVESSVKALSRPVVSRIGARLGDRGVEQLDDFACRQLDRIYPTTGRLLNDKDKQTIMSEVEEKENSEWHELSEEERSRRRKAFISMRINEREQEVTAALRETDAKSMVRSNSHHVMQSSHDGSQRPQNAVVRAYSDMSSKNGSGWGSMLVEAGATAGGLSAAMSEESMKSLKYCLQWLQYATARIEHQITILRDLIVKLNHGELDLTSPAAENLSAIKGDVVTTIRNVVDVVGKYAGGALPEPARGSVKAFILSLPARWASVNRASAQVEGRQGSFGGSPASPSFSSAHISGTATNGVEASSQQGMSTSVARQQAAATAVAANRVLTLAVESLDILRSVTVVFGESLDRADIWVERLRAIGIQRKRAHEQAAAEEAAARIDVGMGGALARGPWESARGMRLAGSESPGAESNLSVGTSGSAKRRRTKQRRHMRGSPSHEYSEEDFAHGSDEGSSTETERVAHMTEKQSNGRSLHASAVHHHFQHPHGSTMSRRTAKGRSSVSSVHSGRQSATRTPPSAGTTPLLHELSIGDRTENSHSRAAHEDSSTS